MSGNRLDLQQALLTLAESRLPRGFAVAAGPLASFATATLFPTEVARVSAARPRRVAGFRGGRACARIALSRLGHPAVAIPAEASGAPVWPTGFVGSISHTDDWAAAIVATTPPLAGLGLDVESDIMLDDAATVELVCRPEELVPDRPAGHTDNRNRGKLLFVVKEAVYKLWSPLAGLSLDFHDVRIALDEAAGTFRATIDGPATPTDLGTDELAGAFARVDGLFIALTWCLPE